MKKSTAHHHTHHKAKKSNMLPLLVLVVIVIVVAFFVVKSKNPDDNWQPGIVEAHALTLGPNKGCAVDPSDSDKYMCNIQIKNTSTDDMEWAADMEGMDGASLSNDGVGTIAPGESGVVTLRVPVSLCDNGSSATGKVNIVDGNRSTNNGTVTFDCSAK